MSLFYIICSTSGPLRNYKALIEQEVLPMVDIVIGSKEVSTKNFVSGLRHSMIVGTTLDDRIRDDPELILKKLWENGKYSNHEEVCCRCIDRMHECGKCSTDTKHLLERIFN